MKNKPFIEIISNGSKWAGEKPDPIEKLFEVLENHPLDKRFERFDFIEKNPLKLKFAEINGHKVFISDGRGNYVTDGPLYPDKNVTVFSGNFLTVSHVFNIATDDKELIEKLTKAIKRNMNRADYITQDRK